jgi:hypothetical protein
MYIYDIYIYIVFRYAHDIYIYTYIVLVVMRESNHEEDVC